MRSKWEGITSQDIVIPVHDMGRGCLRFVARLDDHLLFQAGLFVRLHLICEVFGEIFEPDFSRCFRNNHGVKGIPFTNQVALFHLIALVKVEFRAIRNVMRYQHDFGVGVDHAHLNQTAYYHLVGFSFRVDRLHVAQLVELNNTVVFGNNSAFRRDVGGNTSHVESTQGKLCSRFPDRLCSNNTYRLSFLYHCPRGQVATVAFGTYPLRGFTGKYRTNFHSFDRRLVDFLSDVFRDLFPRVYNNFSRVGVLYIVYRYAAQYPLVE